MKTAAMLAGLALVGATAAAQPWTPSACGKRYEKSWSEFARAMREAKPSSEIYVPKPFPRSKEEVVSDWEYAYLRMWSRFPESRIPEDEVALYRGIRGHSLRYEMTRVENWTPTSCMPDRQLDFYFFLRVRQAVDGKEIARIAVNWNGLWSEFKTRSGKPEEEVYWVRGPIAIDRAMAQAQAIYGIRGGAAQYVETFGTPHCTPTAPCVAFRTAAGKVYLMREDLYEIDAQRASLSHAEFMRDRGAHVARRLDPASETLVTIGADRWVVARRIPRP